MELQSTGTPKKSVSREEQMKLKDIPFLHVGNITSGAM
jgi:hypothetical protein